MMLDGEVCVRIHSAIINGAGAFSLLAYRCL